MKVFWAFGADDINPEHINKLTFKTKGLRTIHLLSPNFKKPRSVRNNDYRQWDVTVKNVSI